MYTSSDGEFPTRVLMTEYVADCCTDYCFINKASAFRQAQIKNIFREEKEGMVVKTLIIKVTIGEMFTFRI